MQTPVLDTPRLLIRGYQAGDEPAIFRFGSDPLTTRYMAWPRHSDLADSGKALGYFLAAAESGRELALGLWDKASGRLVGHSGFENPLTAEPWVSWLLCGDAWGKGYATEAVSALLAWGWEAFPAWQSVGAPIHGENLASIRLAERLGFKEAPSQLSFLLPNLDGRVHAVRRWTLPRSHR